MLDDSRLKHMQQVARLMHDEAILEGLSKEETLDYLICGFLHDIGYEWGKRENHAEMGALIAESSGLPENVVEAIREHGNPDFKLTPIAVALNHADMMVDRGGNVVTMEERLADIGARYGISSEAFLAASMVVERLKNAAGMQDDK